MTAGTADAGRELPEGALGGESEHLIAFLRFHRATVVAKCRSLPPAELAISRVPSGWTPSGLLFHLASMERRWVEWGFLGAVLDDPYPEDGDDPDGPWTVPPGWDLARVVDLLDAVARRTDALLAGTSLDARGSTAGRFGQEAERFDRVGGPPTLRWVGFHLLQEYARHAGHLDVAVELAGGAVGE